MAWSRAMTSYECIWEDVRILIQFFLKSNSALMQTHVRGFFTNADMKRISHRARRFQTFCIPISRKMFGSQQISDGSVYTFYKWHDYWLHRFETTRSWFNIAVFVDLENEVTAWWLREVHSRKHVPSAFPDNYRMVGSVRKWWGVGATQIVGRLLVDITGGVTHT